MVIQLTAPNALCGRVIGRGGTKINGITVCIVNSCDLLYISCSHDE